jgi:MFS family permease
VQTKGEQTLWQNRDFLFLWGGQTVSEVGSSVTALALPLLAVLTLHASTFEVGALAASTNLAFLLVALPAGAWIDRWRRKPVLVWADAGRVIALGSIPFAKALGVLHLPQLYVVALVSGVLTVFFDVAYMSYLPVLVKPDQFVDANGKIGASQSFGQVAGPSLGGLLVGLFGAAYAIVVDAASFLVSTVATVCIRKKEAPPPPRPEHATLRSDMREGLGFVLGHPILRKVVGCTATSNFASGGFAALEAVFLVRVLGTSATVIGLIFTVGSVGGLIGGLLAGRIGRAVGTARVIWLSILVGGPFQVLAAMAFSGWGVSLFALAIFAGSASSVVYNTAQVSYRQSICPPALLGRMNASVRFIVWGTLPLGAIAGGIVGTAIGVREAMYVFAFIGWSAALWVIFSPLFGMRDVPAPEPFPVAVEEVTSPI